MRSTKVLMIDDEPHIRRIGELCLRGVGKWDVRLASSGAEGVTIAAREQPDAILLDMMMPGMDGTATLAGLRARTETAHIPVVFMTANVLENEVALYIRLGASGVIAKPFDPMMLSTELARLVERATRVDPVEIGHVEVEQDQIRGLAPRLIQRLGPRPASRSRAS